MLKTGIKIIGDTGIIVEDRLEINSGGIAVTSYQSNSLNYVQNAYIPSDTWRKLTQMELGLAINAKAYAQNKNSIRILKVIPSIEKLIRHLNIFDARSLSEINAKAAANPEVLELLDAELTSLVNDFERPFPEKKTYLQGFFHAQPGLSTVTIDRNKQFVGLHIDYSVDFHKLYKKDTVNRMCINIGREARYFQYINQSVDQLEYMINQVAHHDFKSNYESRDLPGIVETFFTYYPNYPILKFKLEPFEAYIAPSDNMIHDGSSLQMSEFDISLSLLGFLNVIEHTNAKENVAAG